MNDEPSIQDRYSPAGRCFGCGPKNEKGLRLKSRVDPETGDVVCAWTAEKHHEAFPGMLAGGIIGTLLDCHCNWTAAYAIMLDRGTDEAPCTVTADYHVKLRRPTPTDGPVFLRARVVEAPEEDRRIVEATLEAGGKVTATCRGLFVAVRPGHPAYHRW